MSGSERIKSVRVAILFAATCALVLFVRLIPMDLMPARVAPPDILFALLVALLVRRPGAVPMWLIVVTFLINDMLLSQPLGLWTLVVFVTSELVRNSRRDVRDMLFWSEWVWFAGLCVTTNLAQFALRVILFIPRDPLVLVLPMVMLTIAVYPLVVLFLNLAFGVQKPLKQDFGGMSAR